jgi:hypothetical protein
VTERNYGRYDGVGYIPTGSTAKTFYRSDPYFSGPGEAAEIPLRARYRAGGCAPSQNKHSDNQRKPGTSGRKKTKMPRVPSRVMVMPDPFRGSVSIMTREQFRELDWGWEIAD